MPDEAEDCPRCETFCKLVGDDKGECKEMFQKLADGKISADDLRKALDVKYGPQVVAIAEFEAAIMEVQEKK